MSEAVLSGSVRQVGRKGPARRLRTQGLLPGIIYGGGENVPVTVEAMAIRKILDVRGGVNRIITTKLDGDKKERKVLIKDLTFHPITDTLLHIDLIEVDVNKPIKATVHLEFKGTPVGVKQKGGKMNVNLHSLRLECLPHDIPPVIEIDITGVDLGQMLRVSDVDIDGKIKVLEDPDTQIVSVAAPKVAKESGAEGEGEASEEAGEDEGKSSS